MRKQLEQLRNGLKIPKGNKSFQRLKKRSPKKLDNYPKHSEKFLLKPTASTVRIVAKLQDLCSKEKILRELQNIYA